MTRSNSPSRNWGILVASESSKLTLSGQLAKRLRHAASMPSLTSVPTYRLHSFAKWTVVRPPPTPMSSIVHVVEVANQRPEDGFLGRL